MTECHIEARDLTKIYNTDGLRQTLGSTGSDPDNKHAAVDRVSLCVREGERVGIIGRNGAGKSTLLHMLAGLSEPTSGELEVRGRVTSIMTLGVGMREELSGRENIYMDGEIQGKSRAEMDQVIDEVIAFAELGEFIDLPVRTYSTGMKARLAFAMISYLDPEILIIDEALSAGDIKFSLKASAKIKEICTRGKIVIIVSHSMGSIIEMCERCIWMDAGRIVMEGPPAQVTQAYVDTVRREDEKQILAKFRRHVSNYSYVEGCRVEQLYIAYQNSDVPSAMIEAGRDATIQARLSIGRRVLAPRIHLRIMRLDGLVVADTNLPGDRLCRDKLPGTLEVHVSMHPVVLGPGTYSVTLSILDSKMEAATGATILEVFSKAAPVGGRTALLFPATVNATRIP